MLRPRHQATATQPDPDRGGGKDHTFQGVATRVAQRILAMAARRAILESQREEGTAR